MAREDHRVGAAGESEPSPATSEDSPKRTEPRIGGDLYRVGAATRVAAGVSHRTICRLTSGLLSRFDLKLLRPVYQRSEAAQELRTRLRVRGSLVRLGRP